MKKRCDKCHKSKSLDSFNKNKTKPLGVSSSCKECRKDYDKKWRADNKDKTKKTKEKWLLKNQDYRQIVSVRSHLKRKYGMTIEEYERMVENQNGVCAICKKPDTIARLSVDHNHKTKKIRGLLCRNCNSVLGLAKDSPIILESAIKYLKELNS